MSRKRRCVCREWSSVLRNEECQIFGLYEALPEQERFISTVWSKDPNALWACTSVFRLGKATCWMCRGWRWCGAARAGEERTSVLWIKDYDPARVTEGGLAEAHAHVVQQVRDGALAVRPSEGACAS